MSAEASLQGDDSAADAASDAAPDAAAISDDAAPTADGGVSDATDDAATANTFVDPRDGRSYRTITVGTQTWLAQNLAFATAGSYCYDDDPTLCEQFGRLYTFRAARTACPEGWRLGTDGDWKVLETTLGMSADDLDLEGYSTVRGTDEGTKLKDPSGFGVVPAGFRTGGAYEALDDRAYFWTASTRGGEVWRRRVTVADPTVFRFTNPPADFAISVRCVAN